MTSEEKNRLQIIWFSSPGDSISITTDLGRVTLKPHDLVRDSAIKAPRSVLYHRQGSKSIGSSTIHITAASMMIMHRFRVCSPLQQIIALPFNKTRKLLLTVSAPVLKFPRSQGSFEPFEPFEPSPVSPVNTDKKAERCRRFSSIAARLVSLDLSPVSCWAMSDLFDQPHSESLVRAESSRKEISFFMSSCDIKLDGSWYYRHVNLIRLSSHIR